METEQGKVESTLATTLLGLADEIGANLVITRRPKQGGHFTCFFEHAETKRDEYDYSLASTRGKGCSLEEAMADYAAQIRGKVLVFDARTPYRKEFHVSFALVS